MAYIPTPRHYYRCQICLATSCVEIPNAHKQSRLICGICGGPLKWLGAVQADTFTRKELKCKCDSRCTEARGPHCDCQCGGANHGAGLDGYIEVTAETGTAKVTPKAKTYKHQLMADEYRAAIDAAQARIAAALGQSWTDLLSGAYIADKAQWQRCAQARAQLTHAKRLEVHTLRMKALKAIYPPAHRPGPQPNAQPETNAELRQVMDDERPEPPMIRTPAGNQYLMSSVLDAAPATVGAQLSMF